jgi:hypothetical protein
MSYYLRTDFHNDYTLRIVRAQEYEKMFYTNGKQFERHLTEFLEL